MAFLRSSAVSDRRAAHRQLVAYRLDVTADEGCSGCLLDLSTTGMRVRFKAGLDLGSTRHLRLDFPRWLELGAGLELSGRFVWMRTRPDGATEAGFAFDGLSHKEESLLTVLIQRLAEALAEDAAAAE